MRAAIFAFTLLSAGSASADFTGRVLDVYDGDTIVMLVDDRQVRVGLVDIDAPELGQAFGRHSRDSLARICAGATARVHERGRDRDGRTLGYVTCGVVDANNEQVRRGMAWVFVRYAPKRSGLYQLQTEARLERRGLWSDVLPPVAPWDWRQRQRAERRAPQL
jgi:endonuclease YncB( thermonuclease family)